MSIDTLLTQMEIQFKNILSIVSKTDAKCQLGLKTFYQTNTPPCDLQPIIPMAQNVSVHVHVIILTKIPYVIRYHWFQISIFMQPHYLVIIWCWHRPTATVKQRKWWPGGRYLPHRSLYRPIITLWYQNFTPFSCRALTTLLL